MDKTIQNLSSITDKSSKKYLNTLEEINKKEKNIKKEVFSQCLEIELIIRGSFEKYI